MILLVATLFLPSFLSLAKNTLSTAPDVAARYALFLRMDEATTE
jgi:hypothetical protein